MVYYSVIKLITGTVNQKDFVLDSYYFLSLTADFRESHTHLFTFFAEKAALCQEQGQPSYLISNGGTGTHAKKDAAEVNQHAQQGYKKETNAIEVFLMSNHFTCICSKANACDCHGTVMGLSWDCHAIVM